MNRKNNMINTVVAILSILLVIAIVGFVFKFTNGLNEDLKTFYIEHNGKQIVATDSQMTFDTESEHRFDCKYISNPDNNSYNLEVIPNVTEETDFNYTVDGVAYTWKDAEDITACFTIDKQNGYFIISFPAEFSMETVLASLYPEKEVVISDTLPLYQYYYTLHVSSYNGKINYYIDFNVIDAVDYVSLINKYVETIAQLDVEIDELNSQVAELQDSITEKNSEITTLTKEKEALTSENSANAAEIDTLNSQITALNNQIAELQNSITEKNSEITGLQKRVKTLTDEKTALQESVTYYENCVSKFEDSETAVITLSVDGSVYAVFTMAKGSTMFDIEIPESTDYEFNGWTVNGEEVTMRGYEITENTTFVADLTHGYDISFVVDGVTVKSERVIEGDTITPPENPEKNGYSFDGWVNSSGSVVDFATYTACEKTTFTAEFSLITVTVNFAWGSKSSSSSGSSGGTAFSVTPYWGGIDSSVSYGSFSFDSVDLSVEHQNGVVTFSVNSGYSYSGYEVNSSTSGGSTASPLALTSYPFNVVVSGSKITLTLSSVPSSSSVYTLSVIVTGSGSSSGGSSF